MFYDFVTTTHAKWILAGEHSVVRGNNALVFPVKSKTFSLTYTSETTKLSTSYSGESGADMHILFLSVLRQGMQLLNTSINNLTGHFNLECDIPIGVGLGASAALCAATANWFTAQKLISNTENFSFAKQLENLFHGQSSGLDIAGSMSNTGIYFNNGNFEPLNKTWNPTWFLSSCNQVGITFQCIQKVDKFWETDALAAKHLDNQMTQAVNTAYQALIDLNIANAKQKLAQAINQARNCFAKWGLINDNLQQHMDNLITHGAIAAKPTGSGGGGYVISLWDKEPPAALLPSLIKI